MRMRLEMLLIHSLRVCEDCGELVCIVWTGSLGKRVVVVR